MNKVYLIISLLLVGGMNAVLADQATVNALQESGAELTQAQADAIGSAQGAALVDEIAGLIPSCDASAVAGATIATIVSAAVTASPELAVSVASSAISAAPSQATVIKDAVSAAAPEQADAIMSLPVALSVSPAGDGCENTNIKRNIGTSDTPSNRVAASRRPPPGVSIFGGTSVSPSN